MPSDLRSELSHAVSDYRSYMFGGGSEAAARSFQVRVARLEMIGASARDALERMLVDPDAYTRNAAARVLAGMHDPDAAARLIAAFEHTDRPQLDARSLARLGKNGALPFAAFPRLDQVRHFERPALISALMRRRTPDAEALIETVFDGWEHVIVMGEAAIESIAGWGEPSLLRDVLTRPLPDSSPTVPFDAEELRVTAAHHLALAGDAEGLDRLRAWSTGRSTIRAGEAALRLALLAHPDGVAPTARLLRARGGRSLELALDAAELYRTPMLAPALRGASARSEALTALEWIVGPDEASLDPSLRYASGTSLTLAILADELLSRDEGPRRGAAFNLRAITGEDHGFDLGDDLAGNLAAIDAWRDRASNDAPMGRGGWAFLGESLPPPPPLT